MAPTVRITTLQPAFTAAAPRSIANSPIACFNQRSPKCPAARGATTGVDARERVQYQPTAERRNPSAYANVASIEAFWPGNVMYNDTQSKL
jgi:hypothetical protein